MNKYVHKINLTYIVCHDKNDIRLWLAQKRSEQIPEYKTLHALKPNNPNQSQTQITILKQNK